MTYIVLVVDAILLLIFIGGLRASYRISRRRRRRQQPWEWWGKGS